jgi:poly(3-hydroxybutyrate) depolymerase
LHVRRLAFAAALAGIGLLAACAARDTWPLAAGQHPQRFHRRVTRTVDGELLLYLPAGFKAHADRLYPLLIFLHGSGEAGHDLGALTAQGPPKLVESRRDFPFVVASPQAAESRQGFDPAMTPAGSI